MPTNFVIGQLLMLFAAKEISASKGEALTKPLKLAWCYSAFIFVPVTAYAFYRYTPWSTVYLRPDDKISPFLGPFAFSTYFLGMVFGTLLAQNLIQLGRKKWVYLTLVIGILVLIAISLLTQTEYLYLGSYEEFHSGRAQLIFENKDFMMDLNLMGVFLGLPAACLALYFYKRAGAHL